MLKRTAIRALCNTTAYQRGLDIYRTGKRIQSLDIKSEGAVNMETVRPMSVWKSADSRMRNRSRQSYSAEQHFRLLYPDQGSLQRKPPLS